jgi:hypothetical protein
VFVAGHDNTQAFVAQFFTVAFVGDHRSLAAKIRRDLAGGNDDYVSVTACDADGVAKLRPFGRIIDPSGLTEQCPNQLGTTAIVLAMSEIPDICVPIMHRCQMANSDRGRVKTRTARQTTKYQAWRRIILQIIVAEPAV